MNRQAISPMWERVPRLAMVGGKDRPSRLTARQLVECEEQPATVIDLALPQRTPRLAR
jgi:hypothetical protein